MAHEFTVTQSRRIHIRAVLLCLLFNLIDIKLKIYITNYSIQFYSSDIHSEYHFNNNILSIIIDEKLHCDFQIYIKKKKLYNY